jgi:excisionase family DNA binding protein
MTTTLNRPRSNVSDALMAMGTGLANKLSALGQPAKPAMITHALHQLLDGQDDAAKELRMSIQIHLVRVSNRSAHSGKTTNEEIEEMLSTEEAARLMDCSRPYVAMLIDAQKLTGGVKSKGGHRKVPKSAVLQWIADTNAAAEKVSADDKDYRKAAADAGMYSIPDEVYVKASKRSQRSAG